MYEADINNKLNIVVRDEYVK
jgi:hypothetical protein